MSKYKYQGQKIKQMNKFFEIARPSSWHLAIGAAL